MRKDDVPQDRSFYRGHERACYAVDEDGRYVQAKSRGWEIERIATEQALLELEEDVERERQAVLAGERAPLAYHLATRQMTPKLCAQHVGLATWRVKRHLKPRVFARLSPQMIARYAECLDVDVGTLREVPTEATRVFLDDEAESRAEGTEA